MVVEQSGVDTQKAVFFSSCFAVPELCGLFLPLLHTKEMKINFYRWRLQISFPPLTASFAGSQKLVHMAKLVMDPALWEISVLLMLYSHMNVSSNLLGQQVLSSPETAFEILLD